MQFKNTVSLDIEKKNAHDLKPMCDFWNASQSFADSVTAKHHYYFSVQDVASMDIQLKLFLISVLYLCFIYFYALFIAFLCFIFMLYL